MDFELNEDQAAITEAVEQLLGQHAGPERAVALGLKSEYDAALETALAEAGFLDVATGDETGSLEAALVLEAVSRAGGLVAAGAAALVAPALGAVDLERPIAVALADARAPVRYGGHARTLLVSDGEEARVVTVGPGDAQPVRSNFGYPMGRLVSRGGRSLGPGSGERLRSWWRVALAAEIAGTARAALDTTVDYVKRRRQFGRAIGSFQAVQHRLAECWVQVQGTRWLALEGAAKGAPEAMAAVAAAHAGATANRVFAETHQLSGAMGFTREHPLHVWSMRLQALRLELGGTGEHRRAAAEAYWVRRA